MDFPLEIQSIILSHLSKAHQIIAKNVCSIWNDLIGKHKITFKETVNDLIVTGDLIILQRIQSKIQNEKFKDDELCNLAASADQMDIMKWLIENKISCVTFETFHKAGKNNDIIRYLFNNKLGLGKHGFFYFKSGLIGIFAETGNTDMLTEFSSIIRIDNKYVKLIKKALVGDQPDVLQWILNHREKTPREHRSYIRNHKSLKKPDTITQSQLEQIKLMLSKCFISHGKPIRCFEWILSKIPYQINDIFELVIKHKRWDFVPVIFIQLSADQVDILSSSQMIKDVSVSINVSLFQKLLNLGFKPNGCLKRLSKLNYEEVMPNMSYIIHLALEHGDVWDPEYIDHLMIACDLDHNIDLLKYAQTKKLKYNIITANDITIESSHVRSWIENNGYPILQNIVNT